MSKQNEDFSQSKPSEIDFVSQGTSTGSGSSRKRVLIIDGSRLFQRTIMELLKDFGFQQVGCADSGYFGVDLACSLKPEYIILNHQLPDIDGIKCLKMIREGGNNANVIVCSDDLTAETIRQYIYFGIKHFLTKPVPINGLREALNKA